MTNEQVQEAVQAALEAFRDTLMESLDLYGCSESELVLFHGQGVRFGFGNGVEVDVQVDARGFEHLDNDLSLIDETEDGYLYA